MIYELNAPSDAFFYAQTMPKVALLVSLERDGKPSALLGPPWCSDLLTKRFVQSSVTSARTDNVIWGLAACGESPNRVETVPRGLKPH
jgi:hypothetical protein